MQNDTYLKNLGKEARKSMQLFRNDLLLKRWVKLIESIYKGTDYYNKIRNQDKKLNANDSRKIIENQLILLRKRKKEYINITINDIENFTFIQNFENMIKN